jgi:hypothetical protein
MTQVTELDVALQPSAAPVPSVRIRARVGGMPRWNRVMVSLLRSVGVDAFETHRWPDVPRLARWRGTWRELAGLDIEHVIFPGPPQRLERWARALGVRVVYHFIGSDVLALQKLPPADRARRVTQLKRYGSAFVADGPDLQVELAELGVHASILRCIPLGLLGEVTPLPATFTVLSYWSQRPEFYRASTVLRLASACPDVPFFIVGTDGAGLRAPPNVRFLGEVRDMDTVYERCSVLLRLPIHDGLPKMVLEAQARGRRVVCSQPLPHATHAWDFNTAIAALTNLREHTQPDHVAATYIRQTYDPAVEARRALRLYTDLVARASRP